MKRYILFDHTADLGIEIYGADRKTLFETAAFALYDIMTDLDSVGTGETGEIVAEGADREELLVNYLRESLHAFNGQGLLLKEQAITVMDEKRLVATFRGEFYDPDKHRLDKEIRAVSYDQAEVRETAKGWVARLILDV
jgi:SHS2 domain-containing protein